MVGVDTPIVLKSNPTIVSILIMDVVGLQSGFAKWRSIGCNAEAALKKYTLVLMTPERTESQLRVGEFPEAGRAVELAELIAAEMGLEEERVGWSIEVRDPRGSRLHAVPVGRCEPSPEPQRVFAVS
jgi:hypothetical protein